ncbi:hypothetical protein NLJ89_g6303 [Agrocybe chaxingu]|uniref:Uncharacterized protein n=1 Tax=Agrocybe chaxingu TaxID=84603 RepID=A0A9W8JWR1_9AGAR|nr:hypothetical protein NLJ89_g6303 [Agrocybe chaxingu]
MGTRGLLGFIIGAQRHADYNHYDSYPDALGHDIVAFLLSLKGPEDYEKMAGLVRNITWVDEASTPSPELQRKYSELGFSNPQVSNQSLEEWYCLLDKMQGAAALPAIQNGDLEHLVESIDFIEDTLFCEWAYFIDFENRKFETWAYGEKLDEVAFQVLVEKGQEYWKTLNSDDEDPDDPQDGEKGEEDITAQRLTQPNERHEARTGQAHLAAYSQCRLAPVHTPPYPPLLTYFGHRLLRHTLLVKAHLSVLASSSNHSHLSPPARLRRTSQRPTPYFLPPGRAFGLPVLGATQGVLFTILLAISKHRIAFSTLYEYVLSVLVAFSILVNDFASPTDYVDAAVASPYSPSKLAARLHANQGYSQLSDITPPAPRLFSARLLSEIVHIGLNSF